MAKKTASKRYRNWTFVAYPESLELKTLVHWWTCNHLKGYYALHSLDVEEDGSLKKMHYHIVLMFDSVKTLDQVRELVQELGVDYVEPVQAIGPMLRYLIHADNPEKKQYSADEVGEFGGVRAYKEALDASDEDSDITQMVELFAYIRQNNIISYAGLCDSLAVEGRRNLLRASIRNAYAVMAYLKSVAWERSVG